MSNILIGVVRARTVDDLHDAVTIQVANLTKDDPHSQIVSISHAADPEFDEWSAFITVATHD